MAMVDFADLTESSQGYLEVILDLETAQKVARAKDIADRLGVQRGSVTGALKSLEEKGLIHYQPYSFITLTEAGRKIAEEVAYRHRVLKDFLLNVLQIDEPTAEATACRMEHAIDPKTWSGWSASSNTSTPARARARSGLNLLSVSASRTGNTVGNAPPASGI
jgi:DtxR family transcriptional regulator, Mn-dependent transcriptional regulator